MHDIARMVRQGSPIYGHIAPSQAYAEPKRLERLGLLHARKEPGQTGPRTVYELTDLGREQLRAYLRTPSPFPRLTQEVTLRLLAGDMIEDDEIVASITAMRDELARLDELVNAMEIGAAALPHRERYLHLQNDLGRRLLATYRDWISHVERELGVAATSSDDASSSA